MKRTTIALSALLMATSVFATPSGLNNIPTADVIGNREVAVQAFDTLGNGPHDFWLGMKSGIDLSPLHLEWGLDSHIAPTPSGPLYFQTKIEVEPWKDGKFAVGVANVPLTNQSRAGDPFTYAVLTQDFGFARLSAGYGLQNHGNTVLLGLDRSFKVFGDHELNLNVDLVQTGDQSGWLTAPGLKYEICKHVIFETWVNLPDHGSASVMLKLNYVFKF
jgi:hypothetical protein